MGQALGGVMGGRSPGHEFDDFFQSQPRRLRVLGKLQMPVGHGGEDGGPVVRRGPRPFHPAFEGELRAGQIIHVLGLDGGEQEGAVKIAGEFFQLLAHGGHRLLRMAVAPFGFGHGIKGLGFQRDIAAVNGVGQRADQHRADAGRPDDGQGNAHGHHQDRPAHRGKMLAK